MKGKVEFSWSRLMFRSIWTPHTWLRSGLKRSWLKGIRISAVHPTAVTCVATSQTGSHEASPRPVPLPVTMASPFTPDGFVQNR